MATYGGRFTLTVKKKLGRKEGSKYRRDITILKKGRFTQSEIAKKLGISLSTVKRHWNNGIIG
ncbi:winged helix-turn-helix domain-containing protein [Salmonella enterica subsp. enterica serovar Typhimurium]|nr:winged helix-turn-helix domain-containing protein [Salmonella enterica subsp. enterica serovar Typhimurium]